MSTAWVPQVPLLQLPRTTRLPSHRLLVLQLQHSLLEMHWPLQTRTFEGSSQVPPPPVQRWQVPQVLTQQRPSVQRPD